MAEISKKNETSVFCGIQVMQFGGSFSAGANTFIVNSKGEKPSDLGVIINFVNIPSVTRNYGRILALLKRKAVCTGLDGSVVVPADVALEIVEEVDNANKEIRSDVETKLKNYDSDKKAKEENIREFCASKKFGARKTDKIVASTMAKYPSRKDLEQRPKILLKIRYQGESKTDNAILNLAIENSDKFQKLSEYKRSMLSSFLPMWKHIGNLLNQVSEEGEMSERTLNAYKRASSKTEEIAQYLSTVDNISVENIEISSHELEALAFVAPLAIHSEIYAENIMLAIFKEARYLGIECELPEIKHYSFDELVELSENCESLRDMAKRIAESRAEEEAEGDGEE